MQTVEGYEVDLPMRRQRIAVAAIAASAVLASCGLPAAARSPGVKPAELRGLPDARPTSAGIGLIVEPDDGVRPVTRILDRAQHTIFVDSYILTDRRVIRALERAAAQGVSVYVMLEERALGMGTQPVKLANELRAAGIEYRPAPHYFALDHIKLIVVDDRLALISSANLSKSAFTVNRDLLLVDSARDDVRSVSALFRSDWDRLPVPAIDQHLVVSPINARSTIQNLLGSARHSISMYAEEINDSAVENEMRREAARGISVRALVPNRQAVKGTGALLAAGVRLRALSAPYVHAKMIVVDGSEAYVGSENISSQSLDRNREVGLLVQGGLVARLSRLFDRDWSRAVFDKQWRTRYTSGASRVSMRAPVPLP